VVAGKGYFLILNAIDIGVKILRFRILQWMGRLIQDFYDIDDLDVCEQNRTNLYLNYKKDSGWLIGYHGIIRPLDSSGDKQVPRRKLLG